MLSHASKCCSDRVFLFLLCLHGCCMCRIVNPINPASMSAVSMYVHSNQIRSTKVNTAATTYMQASAAVTVYLCLSFCVFVL